MEREFDLSEACVRLFFEDKPGPKAKQMLVEEIERRTGVRLGDWEGDDSRPVIALGTRDQPGYLGQEVGTENCPVEPEGYFIGADGDRNLVWVLGSDSRGLLFGVGRLLRRMVYSIGGVGVEHDFSLHSNPQYPMRGHQIGYRRKSNTYDSWGTEEYEQYIRDLVAWGANSIELIAPSTSKEVINEAGFGRKAWQMAKDLSRILDSYDLQVHVWMPMNDTVLEGQEIEGFKPGERLCPSTSNGLKALLESRRKLFGALERIDHVFIPGGDPGGCECEKCQPWARTMMELAGKLAPILRENHPQAKIWVSNQMFTPRENDYLYQYIEEHMPSWLGGLVYSPWATQKVETMRERLPGDYQVRNYPDICHSVRCQYQAPDWDHAYALIEGRECPNPRPRDHKHIHNLYAENFCGSVTYSDGVNDDLNKILWSALDWDPDTPLMEILTDYSRYLMGGRMNGEMARGILALEQNWKGSLLTNESVEATLELWREIERDAPQTVKNNWRFQLLVLRAYLDAYVKGKLEEEHELEKKALKELSGKVSVDSLRSCLDIIGRRGGDTDLRKRVEALAASLNQNIGMKLGRKYGAGRQRADILDFLDEPLNNSEWITAKLEPLLDSGNDEETPRVVDQVINWKDAGPGGFYDDLGNPEEQPHLVREIDWEEDPGRVERPALAFDFEKAKGGRLSWRRQINTLWGAPLKMRYENLDPVSVYELTVTYGGYRHTTRLKLDANSGIEVHGPMEIPKQPKQFVFELPREATEGGSLTLVWSMVGEYRGIGVAETWLRRRQR